MINLGQLNSSKRRGVFIFLPVIAVQNSLIIAFFFYLRVFLWGSDRGFCPAVYPWLCVYYYWEPYVLLGILLGSLVCKASAVSQARLVVFFKVLDASSSDVQLLYKWHDPTFLVMVFSRDIHPKVSAICHCWT